MDNISRNILGKIPTLELLRAGDLARPPYQRNLKSSWVRHLTSTFNERGLGVFTVSRREQHNWIIDGQHRWMAILRLGYTNHLVPCMVHEGLSETEEEEMFVLLNSERLAVERVHVYTVAAKQGGQEEAVLDLLRIYQLTLVNGGRKLGIREISATRSLDRIYRHGGERGLARVLYILASAWHHYPGAFRGIHLELLWSLMREQSLSIAEQNSWDDRLIEVLQTITPQQLTRLAEEQGMSELASYRQVLKGYVNRTIGG